MHEHDGDSLTGAERAHLRAWAETDVPDGFADRVLAAMDVERFAPATRSRRWLPFAIAATVLATAAAVVLLLRGAAAQALEPEGSSADELRAQARGVLVRHCSPCHDGADAGAVPKAQAVFDVATAAWWKTPSEDALRGMQDRLADKAEATPRDRERLAAFVAAELRRRR